LRRLLQEIVVVEGVLGVFRRQVVALVVGRRDVPEFFLLGRFDLGAGGLATGDDEEYDAQPEADRPISAHGLPPARRTRLSPLCRRAGEYNYGTRSVKAIFGRARRSRCRPSRCRRRRPARNAGRAAAHAPGGRLEGSEKRRPPVSRETDACREPPLAVASRTESDLLRPDRVTAGRRATPAARGNPCPPPGAAAAPPQ